MKSIIIVSKCTRYTKTKSYFHFKGVFQGTGVDKVELKHSEEFQFTAQNEYLIYVKLVALEGGKLFGEVIKAKELDATIGDGGKSA